MKNDRARGFYCDRGAGLLEHDWTQHPSLALETVIVCQGRERIPLQVSAITVV